MNLYDKKRGVQVRLDINDLEGLDPMLDRQFIQVKHKFTFNGYTLVTLEILTRIKTIKDKHVHKVYWHHGNTGEITLQHKDLHIPEQVLYCKSMQLFGKLYILMR